MKNKRKLFTFAKRKYGKRVVKCKYCPCSFITYILLKEYECPNCGRIIKMEEKDGRKQKRQKETVEEIK